MSSTLIFGNEISPNIKNGEEQNKTSKCPEEVQTEDDVVCTVTCSFTYNGITYTTSAGNWFSTCQGATRRCLGKLDSILGSLQEDRPDFISE